MTLTEILLLYLASLATLGYLLKSFQLFKQ